jgi:hypothetical protein
MQLPFLAHVMKGRKKPFTLVPILVGSLSTKAEAEFARILQPYFADPANFFVISSDFCQSAQTHSRFCSINRPASFAQLRDVAILTDGLNTVHLFMLVSFQAGAPASTTNTARAAVVPRLRSSRRSSVWTGVGCP